MGKSVKIRVKIPGILKKPRMKKCSKMKKKGSENPHYLKIPNPLTISKNPEIRGVPMLNWEFFEIFGSRSKKRTLQYFELKISV